MNLSKPVQACALRAIGSLKAGFAGYAWCSTDLEVAMSRTLGCRVLSLALLLATVHAATAAELPGAIPLAEPLEYTRLFADSAGDSHFADEEMEFALVDFAPPAPAISLSKAFTAKAVAVMSSPSGWHGDWHPAPQRQFIFILFGQLEVEVSDGEVRTFGPGSVVLVEDTSGKGHISRVVSKERGYCAVVPLAEEPQRAVEQKDEPDKEQTNQR